jgi:hypothetical protein
VDFAVRQWGGVPNASRNSIEVKKRTRFLYHVLWHRRVARFSVGTLPIGIHLFVSWMLWRKQYREEYPARCRMLAKWMLG